VGALLLEPQGRIIAQGLASGGIVVEGRDIVSVVAPDAAVKVYLSADPAARAARRAAEAGGDVTATEQSLLARDRIDSGRATAPLVQADGAVHIDTTPYTLDEVVSQVVALVEAVEADALPPCPDRARAIPPGPSRPACVPFSNAASGRFARFDVTDSEASPDGGIATSPA